MGRLANKLAKLEAGVGTTRQGTQSLLAELPDQGNIVRPWLRRGTSCTREAATTGDVSVNLETASIALVAKHFRRLVCAVGVPLLAS